MDFAHLGVDNFLSSNSTSNKAGFTLENAAEINKQKCYGFGVLKQERAINEDDLREFKLAKTSSSSSPSFSEAMLKFPLQRSNGGGEVQQQMLSFSSPASQPFTLPYYQYTSNTFGRITGYGCAGGTNGGSMQGIRGPFTPSQWMELEHQALIYKYITADVPVPSYLLNPIRKAFESAGFPAFRSTSLGWGGFQLGFATGDPEPGRCRRTDGKKWRCSRDAVPEQKYCERHMNRGRHRSRKPVEGQSGHSASAPTTTNGRSSALSTTPVVAAGGVSDALGDSHHLAKLHPPPNSAPLSGISTVNRSLQGNENTNGAYHHTILFPTSPEGGPDDNNYTAHKQQNAYQESSQQEFGLVCSNSLLNPLNTTSSLVTYASSDNLNDHENKPHNPLRQFMDDWPKTHLSISIPMVTSDFMSSTSSPTNEKLASSPPTLSRELEFGLGVGPVDQNQRQSNWVPISWEPSMGGPLGEVLHTTTSGKGECKNTKPLNLIDSWENSPRVASSPTGVLQRGSFVSLSNNSAANSPPPESNGLINSGFMNPAMPTL